MQPSPVSPNAFRFGLFEVDLSSGELRKRGRKVPLQDQPFKVLALLLRCAGQVVNREDFQRALWPDTTFGDFDESLNKAVQKLRQALDDSTDTPRFIETLPRKGYRFIAPVEGVEEVVATEVGAWRVGKGRQQRRSRQVLVAFLAIAFAVIAVLAAAFFRQNPGEVQTVRFQIPLPEKVAFSVAGFPVVSPNGRHVVFAGVGSDGTKRLWLRSLDALTSRPLPGSEDPFAPFWSPDSRFVAFFAEGKLKKIDVNGGTPLKLCDAPCPCQGGAWSRDGTILFGFGGVLHRIPATGGEPKIVRPLDAARQETVNVMPQFLPDGRHFLYLSASRSVGGPQGRICLGSLDSQEVKILVSRASNATYAAPGFLIYGQHGTLTAQPFDTGKLRVGGEPVVIAEQVATSPGGVFSLFSNSQNGVLVYRALGAKTSQLAWYSRDGTRLGSIGEPGMYDVISLSPDEKRLGVQLRTPGTVTYDIWTVELATGIFFRQTFDPNDDVQPVWSQDGRELVFTSDRRGDEKYDLYRKTLGGNEEVRILESNAGAFAQQCLKSGVLFASQNAFYLLRLPGVRKPELLLKTSFGKRWARVSSNERRVAYQSNESGRWEVYVAAFPGFTDTRPVSNGGGRQPQWRKDGKELLYLSPEGKLMSVEVKGGSQLETGAPRTLFQSPVRMDNNGQQYAVTGDGRRFIIAEPVGEGNEPFTVVLNWNAGLKH